MPPDSCIDATVGFALQGTITGTVGCPGSSITEIQVIGPYGLLSTPMAQSSSIQWYINYTWTPDGSQTGANMLCYLATDSNNLSSKLSCTVLIANMPVPKLTWASPNGTLNSSYLLGVGGYLTFTVNYNMNVTRPPNNGILTIVNRNGTVMATINTKNTSQVTFNGNSFSFKLPTYYFPPGTYDVFFNNSVTTETQKLPTLCAESSSIFLWNFTVPSTNL